jgi:hypothetical protein
VQRKTSHALQLRCICTVAGATPLHQVHQTPCVDLTVHASLISEQKTKRLHTLRNTGFYPPVASKQIVSLQDEAASCSPCCRPVMFRFQRCSLRRHLLHGHLMLELLLLQ